MPEGPGPDSAPSGKHAGQPSDGRTDTAPPPKRSTVPLYMQRGPIHRRLPWVAGALGILLVVSLIVLSFFLGGQYVGRKIAKSLSTSSAAAQAPPANSGSSSPPTRGSASPSRPAATSSSPSSSSPSGSAQSAFTSGSVETASNGCVVSSGNKTVTTGGNPNLYLTVDDAPATDDAQEALSFAHANGASQVWAMGAASAKIKEITNFLDLAADQGLGVVFNADFWPLPSGSPAPTSEDMEYRNQFGTTPEAQMAGVVKCFAKHPAVVGFIDGNNVPVGPGAVGDWPSRLHSVYSAMKQITGKPVYSCSHGWTDGDSAVRQRFLSLALNPGDGWADRLCTDQYVWPDSPGTVVGGIGTIKTTTADMVAVDPQGVASVQAFSWPATNPWYAQENRLDTVDAEPDQAALALMLDGTRSGGAKHIKFDSYTKAKLTSQKMLNNLALAMRQAAVDVPR